MEHCLCNVPLFPELLCLYNKVGEKENDVAQSLDESIVGAHGMDNENSCAYRTLY